MSGERVRVLLVEDDPDDYFLIRDWLAESRGAGFELDWAATYEAALDALGRSCHDVCLLDYRLGRRNGLELLREARRRGWRGPLILLTGQEDREVDLEAMQAGAADYLVKGQIGPALVERAIRYALEQHHFTARLEACVRERTKELEHANAALALAGQRKDEFLATLAHELRNPLAPIRNALRLLQLAGDNPATAQQSHEIIERQIDHMVRLVDDLLDMSRINTGKVELRKERTDLSAVVGVAVETARPLIEASGQELRVAVPLEPLYLDADPTRLAQVLSNLLNNSAKYTERGGVIALVVEPAETEVVIRVRDTGIGIPKEMLPRVFEMFTQVDGALERAQGGLGIGLTLVRSLVLQHGGTVEAHSEGPGTGSEFVVRLPLLKKEGRPNPEEGQATSLESAFHLPPSSAAGRRVLLADDNRDAADSLAMLLRLQGHEVHVAFDGAAALETACACRPEVALLDIGMPILSGYEVARRLRERPESRDMVLVALTGWGQQADRQRSREAGFDHHLVKPVELGELTELLAAAGPAGSG